jgi:hypothetical protein
MASSFERALEATVTGGGRLEPEGSAP